MAISTVRHIRCALLVLLFLAGASATAAQGVDDTRGVPGASGDRLLEMQREIARFESEIAALAKRERGVIGEIARFDAELKLRGAELDEVTLRLERLNAQIDTHGANLRDLGVAQSARRRYLGFRLREIYKAGREQTARRIFGGDEVDSFFRGLTYASYLSERDGRVLEDFRTDARRAGQELASLESSRSQVQSTAEELTEARDALAATRRDRSRLLQRIRRDQGQRNQALGELRVAAEELSGLIASLESGDARGLDVRKFKGLLDWPSDGKVSAGFGKIVHPRFGTEVPHPGWDIEAQAGSDIEAVFDGQIVFADWMRGYGLTAIVDHGSGLMSIYAHASVLLVSPGAQVAGGQRLGMVGDTGSLRGAFLYFELRLDGEPIDPSAWLRKR